MSVWKLQQIQVSCRISHHFTQPTELQHTCPRRPQHCRANSRAAAFHWAGAMRSAYGDDCGRLTKHRLPISLCISPSSVSWNAPNRARAYVRAWLGPAATAAPLLAVDYLQSARSNFAESRAACSAGLLHCSAWKAIDIPSSDRVMM